MNTATPSLRQLPTFVSVAEELNFKCAAGGLRLTQPTLTIS
jgi:DNA-binding transcriptional LysR family regulator